MDQERWQQVDRLFDAALELPSGERAAFLDKACAGDAELRKEVESLIAHDRAGSFMDTPASEEATRLIALEEAGSLTGQTIGPYKVLEKLGAGGMGEVYLALHTRTNRQVALKMLPPFHAKDKERVQRFQQEARAVLALNHPNIVTIYDIEQAGDAHIIASEFIEGETLKQRMAQSPLKLQEALDIAIQMAAALAAAHQAGVVHRDIKPENVMLRQDGYVKVLDFGLAKLAERRGLTAASEAPTIAQVNTEPGMVMGTVNYMSPEQARGLAVDERTDIFSFGIVLYEMLTAHLPFTGETKSDVMAAILQKEEPPPLALYWPEAPDALEWIVARALTKEKDERYQTARELLADLKRLRRRLDYEAEAGRSASTPPGDAASFASGGARAARSTLEKTTSTAEPVAAARTMSSASAVAGEIKRHKRGILLALVGLVVVTAGVVLGLWYLRPSQPATKPAGQPFGSGMQMTRLTTSGNASHAAISPDGEFVVYIKEEAGRQSLWLRQTTAASSVQVAPPAEGTRYGAPSFSPDGQHIYYLKAQQGSSRATLYRTPKLGGDERKLIEDISLQDSQNNFSLSPDGKQVAFIRLDASFNRSLVVSDVNGGGERKIISRQAPEYLTGAAWSPDGQTIATIAGRYGSKSTPGGQRTLIAVRVADAAEKLVSQKVWAQLEGLAWLPDSSGLVASAAEKRGGRQLWHFPFPEGEPRRITNDLSDYTSVSLTADFSTLAVVQANSQLNIWTVAPGGTDADAVQLTTGIGRYDGEFGIAWMPDGKVVFQTAAGGNPDIWMMNSDGTDQKQLTVDASVNVFPSVSPDGRYIVFNSDRLGEHGIWRMDASGENVTRVTDKGLAPHCSPDGRWVFYYTTSGNTGLWKVPIEGGAPVPIPIPAKDGATTPVVSPDGKLIACNYLVGGPGAQFHIGVLRADGGAPVKVFDVAGTPIRTLRWTADSRAVVYVETREGVSNLMSQPLDGGAPARLTNFKTDLISSFDWSHDWSRLVLARGGAPSDVVLIRDFR